MKNENKQPVWVTIPEKNASKKITSVDPDKVNNKVFWGAGFLALALFSFMLMMPGKLSELFQGDLFDGSFQVIPDTASQQGGAFFGGVGAPAPEPTSSEPVVVKPSAQENSSSEPLSDAVPIQIDPLQPSQDEAPSNVTPQNVTPEPVSEVAPQNDQVSEELKALLEALTAQVEALKQDGLKKDKEIQALNDTLEQQAIHEAAKPQGIETPVPSESAVPVQQSGTVPSNVDPGVYRNNTHTVSVNPRDILAQNKNSQLQPQQSYSQANLVSSQGTVNSNAALSGVDSQPTTGPVQSIMMAFLLSAFAVLGFGIYRTIRN